jgi:hypothetical protein
MLNRIWDGTGYIPINKPSTHDITPHTRDNDDITPRELPNLNHEIQIKAILQQVAGTKTELVKVTEDQWNEWYPESENDLETAIDDFLDRWYAIAGNNIDLLSVKLVGEKVHVLSRSDGMLKRTTSQLFGSLWGYNSPTKQAIHTQAKIAEQKRAKKSKRTKKRAKKARK